MSNNDFYSIGLSISDGTNKYRLATIQFDSKKEELFYHFSFLRKYNNALIYNNNNTLIEKGNIDHVTFHNSGQIHYRHKKHKSGEYKCVEKKLENNMFYSLAEYGFFPLCINSLNLGKSDYIDKLPIYKKKENEFK